MSDAHATNPLERLKVVTWRVPHVDASELETVTLPADRAEFLAALRDACGATEIVYAPTCQRVLLALNAPGDPEEVARRVADAFEARAGRAAPRPEALGGFGAFAHLAEVASALDSLVPGEPQVLGQMKEAFREAEATGLAGRGARGLGHVFALVFRTAKAVRSGTDLFRGKVSLIPLTLDIVRDHLAPLASPDVVVVGTGEMGARFTDLVRDEAPAARVHAVSRDPARGQALDAFLAAPAPADLVAFATEVDAPVFGPAHAAAARATDGRPLLLLDLSMPRAVDPAAGALPGVRLVALDELTALSERAKSQRRGELDRARAVLAAELDRVAAEYAAMPRQRALAEYRRAMEAAAEERFADGAERFPALFADPEFRKWFERTTRRLAHVAQERLATRDEP